MTGYTGHLTTGVPWSGNGAWRTAHRLGQAWFDRLSARVRERRRIVGSDFGLTRQTAAVAESDEVTVWAPSVTSGDQNAPMTVSGVLIAESILKSSPLEGVTLHVRKVSRADVGDVSAGQPLTWTFMAEETFVVFAGHSFRYVRGDAEGRSQAEAYGRSVGVPETQLDWPE